MITSGVAPESHAATSVRSSRLCVSGRSTGTTMPDDVHVGAKDLRLRGGLEGTLAAQLRVARQDAHDGGLPRRVDASQTQSPVAGTSGRVGVRGVDQERGSGPPGRRGGLPAPRTVPDRGCCGWASAVVLIGKPFGGPVVPRCGRSRGVSGCWWPGPEDAWLLASAALRHSVTSDPLWLLRIGRHPGQVRKVCRSAAAPGRAGARRRRARPCSGPRAPSRGIQAAWVVLPSTSCRSSPPVAVAS